MSSPPHFFHHVQEVGEESPSLRGSFLVPSLAVAKHSNERPLLTLLGSPNDLGLARPFRVESHVLAFPEFLGSDLYLLVFLIAVLCFTESGRCCP